MSNIATYPKSNYTRIGPKIEKTPEGFLVVASASHDQTSIETIYPTSLVQKPRDLFIWTTPPLSYYTEKEAAPAQTWGHQLNTATSMDYWVTHTGGAFQSANIAAIYDLSRGRHVSQRHIGMKTWDVPDFRARAFGDGPFFCTVTKGDESAISFGNLLDFELARL